SEQLNGAGRGTADRDDRAAVLDKLLERRLSSRVDGALTLGVLFRHRNRCRTIVFRRLAARSTSAAATPSTTAAATGACAGRTSSRRTRTCGRAGRRRIAARRGCITRTTTAAAATTAPAAGAAETNAVEHEHVVRRVQAALVDHRREHVVLALLNVGELEVLEDEARPADRHRAAVLIHQADAGFPQLRGRAR